MRDPTLAAVLSAIIPGVGQPYNGRILWLVITPGFWIGTGRLLGPNATSSRPTPRIRTRETIMCALELRVV